MRESSGGHKGVNSGLLAVSFRTVCTTRPDRNAPSSVLAEGTTVPAWLVPPTQRAGHPWVLTARRDAGTHCRGLRRTSCRVRRTPPRTSRSLGAQARHGLCVHLRARLSYSNIVSL